MLKNDYNGLNTKVRAMKNKVLTSADLQNISTMDSISEVINFLQEQPKYKSVFCNLDKLPEHRSQIELLLSFSYFEDFLKIYRFATDEPRKVLSLLFNKLEIDLLKKCLTCMHIKDTMPTLNGFSDFFYKHSSLDIESLCSTTSLDEFINTLSGTLYYEMFRLLYDKGIHDIYQYKVQLDIMHYKQIWKQKNKFSSSSVKNVLTEIFGTEIDLENLTHIYRLKKYYKISSSKIYDLIIPINYKIDKNTLSNLINASTLDELSVIVDKSYYTNRDFKFDNIEYSYQKILADTYSRCIRKYPSSIAQVLSYLADRQNELNALTTILECIRYSVQPKNISNYIITV